MTVMMAAAPATRIPIRTEARVGGVTPRAEKQPRRQGDADGQHRHTDGRRTENRGAQPPLLRSLSGRLFAARAAVAAGLCALAASRRAARSEASSAKAPRMMAMMSVSFMDRSVLCFAVAVRRSLAEFGDHVAGEAVAGTRPAHDGVQFVVVAEHPLAFGAARQDRAEGPLGPPSDRPTTAPARAPPHGRG